MVPGKKYKRVAVLLLAENALEGRNWQWETGTAVQWNKKAGSGKLPRKGYAGLLCKIKKHYGFFMKIMYAIYRPASVPHG